jgi:beta-glucosidase
MRRPTRRQVLGAAMLAAAGMAFGACTPRTRPYSSAPSSPSGSGSTSSVALATFDPVFRFGLATSAYQIEGAVDAGGRGRSIWDVFCDEAGRIADGSSGATACDHFHRWRDDVDLLADLGVQTYRFSIAWPRVFPDGRGKLNIAGLDFYQRLVDRLRERDIAPMATLYHWDLPEALQQQGGWETRDCAEWFGDYAATMFGRLDGVDRWLTINEAKIIAQLGYLRGVFAPGKTDAKAAGTVIHHLGLAHGRAVQALRASRNDGQIGPCLQLSPCYPYDDSAEAEAQTAIYDAWENTLYLDPLLKGRYPALLDKLDPGVVAGIRGAERDGDLKIIGERNDFVGINYYSPTYIDQSGQPQTKDEVSTSGWQQINPQGLFDAVMRVSEDYDVEIAITENGTTDADNQNPVDDSARIDFLRGHLAALDRAIHAGARVASYSAWSFLDNFEWANGYTQRWGLVQVDFTTQTRTPKASARWYAELARSHQLT